MDFRILGPLEVLDDERPLDVGGGKQRSVLALLLLHANEVVSSDRLIDELWPDEPPASAAKIIQAHVSRLRKALDGVAEGILLTRGHGYLLRVEPGQLDRDRFRGLLEDGRAALAADDPDKAAETLRMRSRFGVARRLPSSPTTRSPRRRSAALKSCTSRRSRKGSKPISP
jgi:DNA-binding SARP family transcriptional activator